MKREKKRNMRKEKKNSKEYLKDSFEKVVERKK